MDGRQAANEARPSRSALDWLLVAGATCIFVALATIARVPQMSLRWGPGALLIAATLVLLLVCGTKLWRTTHFH
jgi:hypothetical protein